LFLTSEVAEQLSLRVSDILEYSPTRDAFVHAIGNHNMATLEEIQNLHLYDFGIFIELMPDEEERQQLENNIQMALQQKTIELEDAIDLREIKNIKMANSLLKIRRKKKIARDQQLQQQNIQAQSNANQQSAQAASQAKVQEEQAKIQAAIALEQTKQQLQTQTMQQEHAYKKELMQMEYQLNSDLKRLELETQKNKDNQK